MGSGESRGKLTARALDVRAKAGSTDSVLVQRKGMYVKSYLW